MRVSAALGIKGYKQFQFSYSTWLKARSLKKCHKYTTGSNHLCIQNVHTYKKYSTAHYYGTLLKYFTVIYNEMKPLLLSMCSQMG